MKKLILSVLSSFITTSSFAGVHNYMLWSKPGVKVCFSDGKKEKRSGTVKWKQEKKDFVRTVIEQEYSKERTGIYFIGFEDCETASYKPNVIIYATNFTQALKGSRGNSTAGEGFFSVAKPYPSAKGAIELTSVTLNKTTIIHEFGHTAGLLHEQDHPDAYEAQSDCSSTSSKTVKKWGVGYTEFDEHSVMNYCYIHSSEGKEAGLSEGDIALLKTLYPY